MKVRHLAFILLLASVSMLTACSYAVEFVVINESDQPIEISCQAEGSGDPVAIIGPLSMTNTSQLRNGNLEWRKLSDGEYQVDRENRIVTARAMPNEALLIERVHWSEVQDDGSISLPIERITIVGANGEISLQGREVSKNFTSETKWLYTLIYK
jgi:hypothetical protein